MGALQGARMGSGRQNQPFGGQTHVKHRITRMDSANSHMLQTATWDGVTTKKKASHHHHYWTTLFVITSQIKDDFITVKDPDDPQKNQEAEAAVADFNI